MTENESRLVELIESTANFLRGMMFDPRIPGDAKTALLLRVAKLDKAVKENTNDS